MEDWLRTTVDELREFLADDQTRDDNAERRTQAIIAAVNANGRAQAEAMNKLADAVRGLTDELRRQR